MLYNIALGANILSLFANAAVGNFAVCIMILVVITLLFASYPNV